jgi:hypothetical protein
MNKNKDKRKNKNEKKKENIFKRNSRGIYNNIIFLFKIKHYLILFKVNKKIKIKNIILLI